MIPRERGTRFYYSLLGLFSRSGGVRETPGRRAGRRLVRVEGGGHGFALANDDRVLSFCAQDFDFRTEALNFWSADENHFDRRSGEEAVAYGALELASVGIAANADVERAEAGLVRILNLFGQ